MANSVVDSNGDISTLDIPAESVGLPELPLGDIPACGVSESQDPCSRKGKTPFYSSTNARRY